MSCEFWPILTSLGSLLQDKEVFLDFNIFDIGLENKNLSYSSSVEDTEVYERFLACFISCTGRFFP